jgi:nucleotide-binding universal stress UspA family protein
MKAEKILVPLDGSQVAEAALPRAVEVAQENPRATIVLLRAAEAFSVPGTDVAEKQVVAVKEAEDYLDGVAARLRRQGLQNVETAVWYGAAAPAIVEAAHVSKVDLIVMSTHGRSGLGRLFLGSVAESVLRGTETPILLLHVAGAPVVKPEGAAQAPEKKPVNV